MKRLNLQQQGSDWHEWRKGGIGGSDVAAILGTSPWQTRADLLAHKAANLGKLPPNMKFKEKTKSPRMLRGIREEPRVRALYTELTGIKVEPACCIHDTYDYMRASLDGLNEDDSLVVEIKCPSDKAHREALIEMVPSYYWGQVQHQLAVTGAPRLHYVSWTDSEAFSPQDRLKIVKVTPSKAYIDYLVEEEAKFWDELMSIIKKK